MTCLRQRRRRRRAGRLPWSMALRGARVLLALPTIWGLSMPALASTSAGILIVPICAGDGTHSFYVLNLPAAPGKAPPRNREQGMCAHATCPGENRLKRKARGRDEGDEA